MSSVSDLHSEPLNIERPDDHEPVGRRRWVIPTILGLIAAGIVGAIVWHNGSTSNTAAPVVAATSTATVKTTDLVETTSFDGVLTYSDSRTVKSKAMGTVTWLPAAGTTVKQGARLYDVDETSAYLMYGSVPMYRTLQNGVDDGADVKQLETDLHALGYDPDGMTIDSSFTSATKAAVEAWQSDIGVTQDGVVTPALVQFLPSALRVQSLSAQVGDSVASESALYTASGTGRIATVTLNASDSTVAKTGEQVSLSLPSGETVPGVISSIATTAATSSSTSGGGGGGGSVNQQGASSTTSSSSVDVTVTVTDPKAATQPDQTPVSIAFTSNGAKGVLAVPVTALVALAGGGYALEVQDAGGATHLVAAKPGLYAVGGLVEVSGDGIAEGMTVVIPSGA